jgi:hypothetical protein
VAAGAVGFAQRALDELLQFAVLIRFTSFHTGMKVLIEYAMSNIKTVCL